MSHVRAISIAYWTMFACCIGCSSQRETVQRTTPSFAQSAVGAAVVAGVRSQKGCLEQPTAAELLAAVPIKLVDTTPDVFVVSLVAAVTRDAKTGTWQLRNALEPFVSERPPEKLVQHAVSPARFTVEHASGEDTVAFGDWADESNSEVFAPNDFTTHVMLPIDKSARSITFSVGGQELQKLVRLPAPPRMEVLLLRGEPVKLAFRVFAPVNALHIELFDDQLKPGELPWDLGYDIAPGRRDTDDPCWWIEPYYRVQIPAGRSTIFRVNDAFSIWSYHHINRAPAQK